MQYTGELGQYFRRQVRCSQTSVVVAPRKSPRAKNGGRTCLQTLALESASGAPLSSKRSIGSPTKGARSYSSRAANAIGGLRFHATSYRLAWGGLSLPSQSAMCNARSLRARVVDGPTMC